MSLSVSKFDPPQYEDALRKAEDLEHSQGQARARVVLLYYSSRMEAVGTRIGITRFSMFQYQHGTFQAWREGNDGIADFMLSKIIGAHLLNCITPVSHVAPSSDSDQLHSLLPRDVRQLRSHIYAFD